jgi:hypothetical protein
MKKTNRQMRRKNKTQRGGLGSIFQTINQSRCSVIQDLDQKKNCLVDNTYFSDDEKKKFSKMKSPNQTNDDVLKTVKNNIIMKSVNEEWNRMTEYDRMYKTGNQFKKLLISKLEKLTKNLTREKRLEATREFEESVDKLKLLNMSDTDRQIELNKFKENTAEDDAITVAIESVKKETLLRNACINPDGSPIENCTPTATPMGMGGRTKRYRRRKASRRRKTNKRRRREPGFPSNK